MKQTIEQWEVMDGAILSNEINDYGNFVVVTCHRELTDQDKTRLRMIAAVPQLIASLHECRDLLIALHAANPTYFPDESHRAIQAGFAALIDAGVE